MRLTASERRWIGWALIAVVVIGAALGLLTAEWTIVPVVRP